MSQTELIASPTPILDLQLPLPDQSNATRRKRTRRRKDRPRMGMVRKSASLGCGLIMLAFFAIVIIPAFDSDFFVSIRHVHAPNWWFIGAIFAAVVVSFFGAIAVGEVGFVAAALAGGFDIKRARIGPLLITTTPAGFHAEVDRHLLSDSSEVRIKKLGRIRQKLTVLYAGRSVANTIAGLGMLLLLLIGAIKPTGYFERGLCVCFAGISILLAIINLIPWGDARWPSVCRHLIIEPNDLERKSHAPDMSQCSSDAK